MKQPRPYLQRQDRWQKCPSGRTGAYGREDGVGEPTTGREGAGRGAGAAAAGSLQRGSHTEMTDRRRPSVGPRDRDDKGKPSCRRRAGGEGGTQGSCGREALVGVLRLRRPRGTRPGGSPNPLPTRPGHPAHRGEAWGVI